MGYEIPKPVSDKLQELNQLVEENPQYISVPVIARFLGMNAEGLRASIEHGQCPFGLAWQKTAAASKAYKIPTVTFYMWYTCRAAVI